MMPKNDRLYSFCEIFVLYIANSKAISPTLLMERRAATERALHMNPPPPSPKVKTRPHSPPQGSGGGGLVTVPQMSPSR